MKKERSLLNISILVFIVYLFIFFIYNIIFQLNDSWSILWELMIGIIIFLFIIYFLFQKFDFLHKKNLILLGILLIIFLWFSALNIQIPQLDGKNNFSNIESDKNISSDSLDVLDEIMQVSEELDTKIPQYIEKKDYISLKNLLENSQEKYKDILLWNYDLVLKIHTLSMIKQMYNLQDNLPENYQINTSLFKDIKQEILNSSYIYEYNRERKYTKNSLIFPLIYSAGEISKVKKYNANIFLNTGKFSDFQPSYLWNYILSRHILKNHNNFYSQKNINDFEKIINWL